MAEIASLLKDLEGGRAPSFVPPPEVRSVAISALEKALDGGAEPHSPGVRIARHLGGCHPVTREDAAELGRLARKARDEDDPLFKLMGGAPVLKWTREIAAKPEDREEPFSVHVDKITKVDEELGLVFGWGIICTIDGEPYFDVQGDHIPEMSMVKASAEFAESPRTLGDNHISAEGGLHLFLFPMTADIAKAFGFITRTTGLMVGAKPLLKATFEAFKDGTLTGFSIGGIRIHDEVLQDG